MTRPRTGNKACNNTCPEGAVQAARWDMIELAKVIVVLGGFFRLSWAELIQVGESQG